MKEELFWFFACLVTASVFIGWGMAHEDWPIGIIGLLFAVFSGVRFVNEYQEMVRLQGYYRSRLCWFSDVVGEIEIVEGREFRSTWFDAVRAVDDALAAEHIPPKERGAL